MKTSIKILTPILMIVASAIATFFLAPLNAWKKKTGITVSRVIDQGCWTSEKKTYTPDNCNFIQYCIIWWKALFGKKNKIKDENYTYEGGQIDEITVTPKKIIHK